MYNMLSQTNSEEEATRRHQNCAGISPQVLDAGDHFLNNSYQSCHSLYPSSSYNFHPNTFNNNFVDLQYQTATSMLKQPGSMTWTNTAQPMSYFPTPAMSEINSSSVDSDHESANQWFIKMESTHESSRFSPMTSFDARPMFISSSQEHPLLHQGSVIHNPINVSTPETLLQSPTDNLGSFDSFSFDEQDLKQTPCSLEDFTSEDSDDGEDAALDTASTTEDPVPNEPYAKLIYRALLNAPNYSMALQEIYKWFADNTDKVRSGQNGWKNSIRHNLSMNAAFNKLNAKNPTEETKKNSIWILDPKAVRDGGVDPTTRYRKNSKKSLKSSASTGGRRSAGRFGARQAEQIRYKQRHTAGHNPSPYFPLTSSPTSTQHSRYSSVLPGLSEDRQITPSTPTFDGFPTNQFSMKQEPPCELRDAPPQYSWANSNVFWAEDCSGLMTDEALAMQHWSGC